MSLTDNLGTAVGEILEKTLNRYRLSIPTCNSESDFEYFFRALMSLFWMVLRIINLYSLTLVPAKQNRNR